ncbi:sugar ABC transporter permease [Kineosporia sp. NBRC 101731]|uniref:carbohydrate ABC transporter permease n=1 Tax=Kineosporia sp. NBRC 101731 TaxID=3032199 RepID=UPI0024A562F9|nr:sugar ABC transporter permease [Kineosporia sp. NBRC 101731]GLY29041.1 sugar transporter [Kineosporia sp. NBRC 101731]
MITAWARRRSTADHLSGWMLVAPSVLLIGLFGLVPLVWSFAMSFQRNDLQTPAEWVGLHNYDQMLGDPVLVASLRHTVIYTVLFVPLTLIGSLMVAGALNRNIRGISIYRLAVFVPVITSTVATGVIFNFLLDPEYGLANGLLEKVGLPAQGFFSDPDQALYAMVAMTVWGWIGFGALIYLAALQSVPKDLLEAAALDGCGPVRTFWQIQVPQLRPVTAFLTTWLIINALQLFDEVYVTTKGGPLHATTVVVYYLYQQAFQYFHAGYASALACLLFVVIVLVTLIQMRLTRANDESGAA